MGQIVGSYGERSRPLPCEQGKARHASDGRERAPVALWFTPLGRPYREGTGDQRHRVLAFHGPPFVPYFVARKAEEALRQGGTE